MQSQSFTVRPGGLVKGGSFYYSVDEATGQISYSGQITVGLWPFSKTVQNQGAYKVDPKLLLSSGFTPGQQVIVGPVTLRVIAFYAQQKQVEVAIEVSGQPLSGTAVLDVASPLIKIVHVSANVSVPVLGMLHIEADPAPSKLTALGRAIWARLIS